MTIPALIEALGKAEGPSRDLDATIATTVGGYVYEKRGRDQKAWFYPENGGWRRQLHCIYSDKLPNYTASLDAATALVERVLPGWRICFDAVDGIAEDVYFLSPDYREDKPHLKSSPPVSGKPVALALCIALLKALEAKEAAR